jgi:pimeloyl-ACP methyl ester carboxylesterase
MRGLLIAIATIAALVYAGLCAFLYMQQRELIYYGWTTTTDAADTDFALRRPDATLRGWVVNPGKPDPILYFGGNAERVEANREKFARLFPERSVYLLAYRGYGASDGEPSEAALVADAAALYDQVRARHPGQRIAAIGRSLGSGVAAQLAARRPLERLALITPFDSLTATAQGHYPLFPVDWLLRERYESARALRGFSRPLLILHGGRDDVVPEARTRALIDALPARPQVLRFDAAGHDDIGAFPQYADTLSAFMR